MFCSLQWRPTTWWGPANLPSLWRWSASLASLDMSSGRLDSIFAAHTSKYFKNWYLWIFFQEQGQDHNEQTGWFSFVHHLLKQAMKKIFHTATRLVICWGQSWVMSTRVGWLQVNINCFLMIRNIDCWRFPHCLLNSMIFSTRIFISPQITRSWCPWLTVPGWCQKLLPRQCGATRWSAMIWVLFPLWNRWFDQMCDSTFLLSNK